MRALTAILVFVGYCAAALAGPLPADEAFRFKVSGAPDGTIRFDWSIADGYYLYRDHIKARNANGKAVKVETSPGTHRDDPDFGPMEVYYGHAQASMPAHGKGPVELVYQGCQVDGICYRPETRVIDAMTLAVTDPPHAAGAAPVPAAAPPATPTHNAASPSTPLMFDLAHEQGLVSPLLERGGVALMLASFLLFGLALAFTPCVFPMYPILAATLAREGGRLTPRRGFALSAIYAVFLATAFALLGAVTGWSGKNLQMALQSPVTAGVVAVIFAALALSMFGLFELRLPGAWTNAIVARTGGGSKRSAAVLGFSSALIVGPCVTAPLAGALLYIGQSANIALGAAALFALGIGKGIPLIALATLGAGALPRAGAWMENAKRLFGFGFMASAIWMATPLMPAGLDLALWAALLIGVAGFFFSAEWAAANARIAARASGAVSLVYGAILMVGAASGGTDPLKPLAAFTGGSAASSELAFADTNSVRDLLARLDTSKGVRPTLVYFTADWCAACRTIERSVLADAAVRARLGDFTLIKADLSDPTGQNTELMQKLAVAGPPTMIFFDRASRETAGTRLVGDVTVESLSRSVSLTSGI